MLMNEEDLRTWFFIARYPGALCLAPDGAGRYPYLMLLIDSRVTRIDG